MKHIHAARLLIITVVIFIAACSSKEEKTTSQTDVLFPVKDNSRYGYMSPDGKIVVTPAYDYAWNFKDGMGRFKIKGKYGFVNSKGEVVIEPKISYADDFQDGFARINTSDTTVLDVEFDGYSFNSGWTFIDKKGVAFNETFAKAEYLRTGYAQVKDDPSYETPWEYATLRENSLTREARNIDAMFSFNGHAIAPALDPDLNKVGAINRNEEWIIQPEFDAMETFSEGYAAAKKGNAYGYVDTQGKWIYKQVFPANDYVYLPVDFKSFSNGLAAVKMGKEAYGYINTSGQPAFPQRFRTAYSFNKEGYAIVTNESGTGLIDKSGAFIIKPNLDISDVINDVVVYRSNQTFGVKRLKTQKEILPPVYDNIEVIGNLIKVTRKGATYGYIDDKGKFVIAPQFDYAWPFVSGKAIIEKDEQYQYVNRSGKLIGEVPEEHRPYYYKPSTDFFATIEKEKFGFTSSSGDNFVIDPTYDFATDFEGTIARVNIGATFNEDRWEYAGGKWGLIDKKGTSILPATYEIILPYKNGVALINEGGEATYSLCEGECEETVYYTCAGGKWGMIDTNGKQIIDPQYDMLIPFGSNYLAKQDGIVNLIDRSGKKLNNGDLELMLEIEDASFVFDYSSRKLIKAFENGKAGILTNDGSWLVQPAFDDIVFSTDMESPFTNDLMIIKKGDLWGFADKSGNIVIPAEYEELRPFSEKLAAVRRNELWGFIDTRNTLVIEHKYFAVRDFQGNVAIVQLEDGSPEGVIDRAGRTVFEPEEGTTLDFNGFTHGLCIIYSTVENTNAGYPTTKAGVISDKGKVIFNKSSLDEARINQGGLIYAVKNNKWALASNAGVMISGYNFSWIEPYNGQSLIRCNVGGEVSYAEHGIEESAYGGRWGYIDNKGNTIIPFSFSEAGSFSDGLAPARTSEDLDEIGYVTLDGTWARPLTR